MTFVGPLAAVGAHVGLERARTRVGLAADAGIQGSVIKSDAMS